MGSVVFNGQSVRPRKVVCVGKNYAIHRGNGVSSC